MDQQQQTYLDKHAAARRLHRSPETLARWRSQGHGPPYIRMGRPGGRVLYPAADLEAWLQRHRIDPAGEAA